MNSIRIHRPLTPHSRLLARGCGDGRQRKRRGMTEFHLNCTNAAAADKEARRLYNLEYRWNQRFRLWEHPDDLGIEARARRLVERQRAARAAAEEAEWQLSQTWD